jgi:uncharacterized protein YdcH (DUF465 family)
MEKESDLVNEFGPFTPQELEKVIDWLQSKNLKFEIGKDQHVENQFRINDGQNIVARAEFRTEVYLAQIFRVHVESMSSQQTADFHRLFNMTEKVPARFTQATQNEDDVDRMKNQNFKKRMWATVAAVIMGGPILLTLFKILFKGE